MPADPCEYYTPGQKYCDLKFYLALMVLRIFTLLIKSNDFGTEIQHPLVEWIIFRKAQSACLPLALGKSDCFDHLSVLGGPLV